MGREPWRCQGFCRPSGAFGRFGLGIPRAYGGVPPQSACGHTICKKGRRPEPSAAQDGHSQMAPAPAPATSLRPLRGLGTRRRSQIRSPGRARENSPGREPWVGNRSGTQAPEGRQKTAGFAATISFILWDHGSRTTEPDALQRPMQRNATVSTKTAPARGEWTVESGQCAAEGPLADSRQPPRSGAREKSNYAALALAVCLRAQALMRWQQRTYEVGLWEGTPARRVSQGAGKKSRGIADSGGLEGIGM